MNYDQLQPTIAAVISLADSGIVDKLDNIEQVKAWTKVLDFFVTASEEYKVKSLGLSLGQETRKIKLRNRLKSSRKSKG